MNRETLDKVLATFGLKVDDIYDPHHSSNKFRDLYINVDSYATAERVKKELLEKHDLSCLVNITEVENPQHEDFGKPMLEIKSFWND